MAAAKHVGSRVYEVGKKAGKQVIDRAVQVAERNMEHYTQKAEGKLQSLADKAEFHISQYDRPPKKASGYASSRRFSAQFGGGRGRVSWNRANRLNPGDINPLNVGTYRPRTISQLTGFIKSRRGRR